MIAAVWRELGGPEPDKRGRARAWWRNPGQGTLQDRNVHLEGERWYDFARSRGGGPLQLVQHVLGCDSHSARRWLRDRGFHRDALHRVHSSAPRARKQDVEDFRCGLSNVAESALVPLKELACLLAMDDPEMQATADRIAALTALTQTLRRSPQNLYRLAMDRCPRAARYWIKIGREDCTHVDQVAAITVRILELADSRTDLHNRRSAA
jgi:hypothetical protein